MGVELKDAACAETKVIIALQIQEGREAMASKEYVDQYTKAGTAVVLRLTQPWHGSGRVVNGDSAFASVTTAMACQDKGLHFTGLVKKATTMFPKKYFDMQEYVNNGSSETLTASIDGNTFIAPCWADTTRKYFISTHNTTLDGNPHGKKRWREIDDNEEHGTEVVYQYTKRTRLVHDYFAAASVIDISNHARQSGLALETAWVTQHWDHRVISTILGIIAFHMWQHFHPQGKDYSHADFTEEVAYRLLTSEEPPASEALDSTLLEPPSQITSCIHVYKSLSSLDVYISRGKSGLRRCCECGSIAAHYCPTCSDVMDGKMVTLSGLQRGSECLMKHAAMQQ